MQIKAFIELANGFLKLREHEIILTFLCIVALSLSFLNPLWFSGAPEAESSVYAIIGKLWANDHIPYRDMIDVQGPGIFFINMLGFCIGGYKGIAFLESIFLLFGVISVDLALRKFKFSPLARFSSIVIVISLLALRYRYGNVAEDYTLYFAMIASYPLALLYKYNFNWFLAICVGALFGLTVSVGLTYAAYFFSWFIMLIVKYVCEKKYTALYKFIISILVPIFIIVGGFSLYFYQHGDGLLSKAVYYSLFVVGQNEFSFEDLLIGFVGLFRTGLWIILIGFFILVYRFRNTPETKINSLDRFYLILYIILGLFFAWIFNCRTADLNDNYDLLFLPFMFIPLAFLMQRYLHVKKDIHISFLAVVALIVFLSSESIVWGSFPIADTLKNVYKHILVNGLIAFSVCGILILVRKYARLYRHNHTFFLCLMIVISLLISIYSLIQSQRIGKPSSLDEENIGEIVSNTSEIDKIWVDGDRPEFYVWTDRMPVAPTLFSSKLNPGYDALQQVLNGITYFKPKYIVIDNKMLEEYANDSNKLRRYSLGHRAYYDYILKNYDLENDGLYILKTFKAQLKGENTQAQGSVNSASATTDENSNVNENQNTTINASTNTKDGQNEPNANKAPVNTNENKVVDDNKASNLTNETLNLEEKAQVKVENKANTTKEVKELGKDNALKEGTTTNNNTQENSSNDEKASVKEEVKVTAQEEAKVETKEEAKVESKDEPKIEATSSQTLNQVNKEANQAETTSNKLKVSEEGSIDANNDKSSLNDNEQNMAIDPTTELHPSNHNDMIESIESGNPKESDEKLETSNPEKKSSLKVEEITN